MAMQGLVDVVEASPDVARIATNLRARPAEYLITGLSGSQKSLYISAICNRIREWTGGPQLVLTHNTVAANRLLSDLRSLLPAGSVLPYPALETYPHEEVTRNLALSKARLSAIEALLAGEGLVVASVQAVAERIIPQDTYQSYRRRITPDSQIEPNKLAADLAVMGYERVERVEGPGQFGIRGGIIDIYPLTADTGVRIELFDTEVDSIRSFEPTTQRSVDRLDSVTLGPAREFFVVPELLDRAVEAIERAAARQVQRLKDMGSSDSARLLEERTALHIERLVDGVPFPGMDLYKPYFFPQPATLLDYLPAAAVLFVDDPARSREQLAAHELDFSERHTAQLEKGRTLADETKLFAGWNELYAGMKERPVIHVSGLATRVPGMDPLEVLAVDAKSPDSFHGQFDKLVAGVRAWRKNRFRICMVFASEERGRNVVENLREAGIEAHFTPHVNGELEAKHLVITTGSLAAGCELPKERLVVLTEEEVFGRRARRRVAHSRRGSTQQGTTQRLESFTDLKEGDYVVHVNHGIGRYIGVETLEIGGVHKDYLVVQYAGDDKLYVPTDQVDLLQKYIGLEDGTPKLYKLGGSEWARVKKKVKESVQEIADGLLKLYAEREATPGFSFSPDTVWQQQFEEAFPYEETDDQMRAIDDVKGDMERGRPMDRLLCGDVGYGKTEVAIRAAFKCVMEGKQVAVLVPTTILAQQHGRTFQDRFESYPVRIRVLSRFQTAAEQNAVMKELAQGTVDIVIGTHRLLSKDVKFKDLGLVVVDEEQRFGVVQKERLKELRKNVDVLTLTATPIPRTLHMSMVGVRDMSLIETPPEDRYPIRTYVVEFDEEVMREAILRELGREGQVYFVYNQVRNIDTMYRRLADLVPEARIAVAHGQMHEDQLEQVMLDFLRGEHDVLLCSTIIETGMDIANVNTLIIYDADRLGLAQLYQLRGRVGRSNRLAYAYFTYRRDKILSEQAEKRLQAIKEFTELGSGFKIAMRDLEIRGAGNILGPEQHGFIASVGFELYCKLLEESIRERKGEVVADPPEPVIDLNVEAYIPDTYIGDSQQKVEMYKKIVAIRDPAEADELEDELVDRFGDVVPAVSNLLTVARLKGIARELGVGQIVQERDGVVVRMLAGLSLEKETVMALMRKFRGNVASLPGRPPGVKVRSRGLGHRELLALLTDIVSEMKRIGAK